MPGIVSNLPTAPNTMAIDRIASSPLPPLALQRPETGGLALPPVTTQAVTPLIPVDPFTNLMPEAAPKPGLVQPAQVNQNSQTQASQATLQSGVRDSTAMQENQVFFSRQMVWQAPDATALATSWRVMVKTYGEQNAAMEDQARGQRIPASLLMTDQNPSALRDSQRGAQPLDIDAWRFAVYGWGGQRMWLRLLPSEAEQEKHGRRQRRGKVALRLEMALADGAKVVLQMEPMGDGILLELASADSGALDYVRLALPELARVIGEAGLRIVRCRVGQTPFPLYPNKNVAMRAAAAALTPDIFRAMAEAALFLSRPAAPPTETTAAADTETETEAALTLAELIDQHAGVPRQVAAPLPELIEVMQPHGDWKWEE